MFQLDVSKPGAVDMVGTIKINVHYFEDGNVQLHTEINKTAKVQVSVCFCLLQEMIDSFYLSFYLSAFCVHPFFYLSIRVSLFAVCPRKHQYSFAHALTFFCVCVFVAVFSSSVAGSRVNSQGGEPSRRQDRIGVPQQLGGAVREYAFQHL